MSLLALLASGRTSSPTSSPPAPPGTPAPAQALPPAPSPSAEALRFHGGDHVRVVEIGPATTAADISTAFYMTNMLRAGFGVGATRMDYRTVFLCAPGTYNVNDWPNMIPWTSIISATGTGDPDDVIFTSDAGSWGLLGAAGGLHLEGIRLNSRFSMVGEARQSPKYCIHDYGGHLHMAHCYLWQEDPTGWGTGAVFGADTNPGDHYQWFDVALRSGVGELPPRAAWIVNAHIDAGEVAPDPVRWRLKQVSGWPEGIISWGSTIERLEPILMDSVQMEDCVDLSFPGTINRPTDPIVWDIT